MAPVRPFARPIACLLALAALVACDADGDGYTRRDGDCDNADRHVHPGADERCANGVDDDCNGLVDAADPAALWPVESWEDRDGDGFAGTSLGETCSVPAFWAGTDCDDTDAAVSPAAVEACDDGIDNDCSGGSPECPGIGLGEDRAAADLLLTDPADPGFDGWLDFAGACGDLDGDGAPDIVLASSWIFIPDENSDTPPPDGAVTLAIFDGSLRGEHTPADAWARPLDRVVSDFYVGVAPVCPGDADGDGRSEIAVAADGVGGWENAVYLLGAPERGARDPEVLATWRVADDGSASLGRAGDVDGDGAADLVVKDELADDGRLVALLPGTARGTHPDGDGLLVVQESSTATDVAVGAGGDGDGDGVPDLAVGIDLDVYVYSGEVRGEVALRDADLRLRSDGGNRFADQVAWLDDPAVGAARLLVYDGAPWSNGSRSVGFFVVEPGFTAAARVAAVYGSDELLPDGFSRVGDVDGDGAPELALMADTETRLIPAPREGTVDLADATMSLLGDGGAADAGDVDGDGHADVAFAYWEVDGDVALWLGGPPQ